MVLVGTKRMRFVEAGEKYSSNSSNLIKTNDFTITLFCRVDDQMQGITKHPQDSLYPSEVVTLAILFALKGVGNRAFYRWLVRDYK
jgi:hypothetical protein